MSTRGSALAIVVAAISAGCTDNAACKPGTVFLELEYSGAALAAPQVIVIAQLNGRSPISTSLTHRPGVAQGSVEIDFPQGFPSSGSFTVTVQALQPIPSTIGLLVASATTTIHLNGSCQVLMMALGSLPDLGVPEDQASQDLSVGASADLSALDLSPYDGGCAALSGLLAYYSFEGDTLDHSGNGNNISGSSVVFTSGKLGQGITLGSGGSLSVSSSTQLSGARTLCAWINAASSSGLGLPVFVGGTSGQGDFFGVRSSGGASSACGNANQMYQDHWSSPCLSGPAVANGAWQFVCWTWDGGPLLGFYGSGSSMMSPSAGLYSYSLGSMTIGSSTIGGTTTVAAFVGTLDEASVWNRALTKTELDLLYNGGSGCLLR
jgi:hypothetical protein